MISSSGKYFVGLDHVRAVAAFLVFTWHFIHVNDGQLARPPIFPLSLLSEGHTGVALFMTLSGYLFAKLLDGKQIDYFAFLWNRLLRLGPLLVVIGSVLAFSQYLSIGNPIDYVGALWRGEVPLPLPSGIWSIFVEFNFYLVLPLLLWIARKTRYGLLIALLAMLLARQVAYIALGEIQMLAYWTIVGRIDQFLLGILAFQFRDAFTGRHARVLCGCTAFLVYYWYFDWVGGFYDNQAYPSPSGLWATLPTIEGVAYAALIAWYDNSFQHGNGPLSRFVAAIGTYSYSIYLLHFYLVFRLAAAIDAHVLSLANLHVALAVAPFAFLLMVPLGYLSFRFIESPLLKLRTPYFTVQKQFMQEQRA